jgi:hypothetical protein
LIPVWLERSFTRQVALSLQLPGREKELKQQTQVHALFGVLVPFGSKEQFAISCLGLNRRAKAEVFRIDMAEQKPKNRSTAIKILIS